MRDPQTTDDAPAGPADSPALRAAVRALLEPLARYAVARGLPYAAVDAMLREAFVAEAHAAHPDLPEHRRVSRISAATGLNRREVTRLLATQAQGAPAPRARSTVNELFAHWTTDPQYLDTKRRPRALPRLGPAPSFETLAQAVTRDKHPRSLLEELLRLGLATHDPKRDRITLVRDAFVPSGDRERLDGFLGANVGDHLAAAVENVLGDNRRHFEQAMFADGLSPASVQRLRELIGSQWRALTGALVPVLEQMVEQDAKDPTVADRRVRVGLFSYEAPAGAPAPAAAPAAPPARRAAKTTARAPAAAGGRRQGG